MTSTNDAFDANSHDNLDQDLIDTKFMNLALKQAQIALNKNEVPIGAVIVDKSGSIISKAHNLRETLQTPLGHAEVVAIHRASQKLNSWRLLDCTLYVTLEPCFMCAGLLVQSRIKRVVFGTHDAKGGALGSLEKLHQHQKLNHQFDIKSGVLQQKCSSIISNFFKQKRVTKKKT
jgi:tRNA(adenine34) deaminase